ncbi:MAG: T9SS type A sorting domain-containing protein [Flavobacterium sp.]|nr:T9SS type A sorting domain-containing protein [Flavobacterium sp.]
MKNLYLFLVCFISLNLSAQFWTEVAPFANDAGFVPRQISIVDNNVVWVNGANPSEISIQKWSRSLDSGLTWEEGTIDLGNAALQVSSIYALSAEKAYVSAFSTDGITLGGVWVTTDSGATWTQQTTALFNAPLESFPNFIHFFDNENGIVAGDPENGYFEIYTTTDGGQNWTRVPSQNMPTINNEEYGYSLKFEARDNSVWFGTNKGRLFKSDDKGLNWVAYQTPLSDFSSGVIAGDFAFKNSNDGLLISSTWSIWKTTDGGANWTLMTNSTNDQSCFNYDIERVPGTTDAYFAWGEKAANGERSSTYSLNGGFLWDDLSNNIPNVTPIQVKFKSSTVGFCIGNELPNSLATKFYKLTDPLNVLGGTLSNATFNTNHVTVFPNPTRDILRISSNAIQEVKVVDLDGKLLFEKQYLNLKETTVDISNFTSGIYVVKITLQDGTSAMKKIIKY